MEFQVEAANGRGAMKAKYSGSIESFKNDCETNHAIKYTESQLATNKQCARIRLQVCSY